MNHASGRGRSLERVGSTIDETRLCWRDRRPARRLIQGRCQSSSIALTVGVVVPVENVEVNCTST